MNALQTLNEVFRIQQEALERTRIQSAPGFEAALEILLACRGKIVVTGVGKSGIIARKISSTLASTGSPSVFIHANEALHGDLGILGPGDAVVMVSKSGTTPELIRMFPKIQLLGLRTIGILGNTGTALAARLDCILDGSVREEGGPLNLAPMASTTVALVLGDALAAALMTAKGIQEEDFAANHPAGQLGKNLLVKAGDVMHSGEAMPALLPGQSIREAILELTRKNLGGLCITGPEGNLEGFLTDGDIRRYLSVHDDLLAPVAGIMTRNPVVCHPSMTLGQVLAIMENPSRLIYVAPVVESGTGRALGLIRMHDILGA